MIRNRTIQKCFQFIEFPSEWGGQYTVYEWDGDPVSNLLSSPASGEVRWVRGRLRHRRVSNLLSSPASGETTGGNRYVSLY